MKDLVNALASIQQRILDSGITLELLDDRLWVAGPGLSHWLRIIPLYRASSRDVLQAASQGAVLVLSAPTDKAIAAVAPYNHIVLPEGSFRLIAPGLALMRESLPPLKKQQKRTKLAGRTGIVAETLLQEGNRPWAIHELAQAAQVSKGLVHRVLTRLEADGIVAPHGSGPDKKRIVTNPVTLAEIWSQEEQVPAPLVRGYLYGPAPAAIAEKMLAICPDAAVGGALAANLHHPILTKAPYPLRLWVPTAFLVQQLLESGLEVIDEGANVEVLRAKDDPWRVHRDTGGLPKVSGWRAWSEIAGATGRTGELADALFTHLKGAGQWM